MLKAVMTRKNKYAKGAKLSEKKFRELIKLFSVDLDASQIAKVTGLNRNTVNRYLREIRKRIAQHCEEQSPFFGEVEVDESYFGARAASKAEEAAGRVVKPLYLVFSNAMVKSTRKLFLTVDARPFRRLSEAV